MDSADRGESAGYLLLKDVPVVPPSHLVKDIEELLVKESFEDVDYIYVERPSDHFLIGVFSVKELFKQDEDVCAEDFMTEEVHSVRPSADQEDVVKLAIEKGLKSVPVVDHGCLLGVVPHHTLLRVIRDEGVEDSLFEAGIDRFDDPAHGIIHASARTHFKKRLPWLLLGLVGGTLAAVIVGGFEEVLGEFLILAAFIPAVVYMADAVGNQTQTIFIRSIALEDISLKRYLWREVKVTLGLGLVLGLIFFGMVSLIWDDAFFGVVIGTSVFLTSLIAMIVGTGLPWISKIFDYDPAVSTGPFSTALIDLVSLLVYFGVATGMIYFFF